MNLDPAQLLNFGGVVIVTPLLMQYLFKPLLEALFSSEGQPDPNVNKWFRPVLHLVILAVATLLAWMISTVAELDQPFWWVGIVGGLASMGAYSSIQGLGQMRGK